MLYNFKGLGFLILGREPAPPIGPLRFALPGELWHVSPASPGPQTAARLISKQQTMFSGFPDSVQCMHSKLDQTES